MTFNDDFLPVSIINFKEQLLINKIWIKIQQFSFDKFASENVVCAKWWPFFSGLDVLSRLIPPARNPIGSRFAGLWLNIIMLQFDIMPSSNENISASLAPCVGNSPVTGEFPSQKSLTRSFYVFFELRLNKRLSKQTRRLWFETLLCWLWRHYTEHLRLQNRKYHGGEHIWYKPSRKVIAYGVRIAYVWEPVTFAPDSH